jgi:hypothetical protein
MPTRDEAWPAGTPNWVDLAADDPRAAGAFYGELFGWTIHDPGPEAGGYLLAMKNDRPAAGIGNKPDPAMPANWATYIATDDADQTAEAVTAAGGTLHMEPFDVLDQGRMFFGTAPDGSTFGVWQAGSHIGAGIYNEPGAYSWNELHSHDLDAAKAFYSAVFGYEYDDMSAPDFTYVTFKRPGGEATGGMTTAAMLPEGVPSVWLTWFTCASTDDTVAKVRELGGEVRMEPNDSPFGRMAVVAGAQGEVFGLLGPVSGEAAASADA